MGIHTKKPNGNVVLTVEALVGNMGIGPMKSSSMHHTEIVYRDREVAVPNPDPFNFEIEKYDQIGKYTAILVYYPDATSYEGYKAIVVEDKTIEEIQAEGVLDPHFSRDGFVAARFRPDTVGYSDAVSYCYYKNGLDSGRMGKR